MRETSTLQSSFNSFRLLMVIGADGRHLSHELRAAELRILGSTGRANFQNFPLRLTPSNPTRLIESRVIGLVEAINLPPTPKFSPILGPNALPVIDCRVGKRPPNKIEYSGKEAASVGIWRHCVPSRSCWADQMEASP